MGSHENVQLQTKSQRLVANKKLSYIAYDGKGWPTVYIRISLYLKDVGREDILVKKLDEEASQYHGLTTDMSSNQRGEKMSPCEM